MKKYKKLSLILASILCAFAFLSCYNDVFYEITQDVESEDATVSGVIAQITRYTVSGTEYLVCNADGGLRYKLASNRTHGSWSTYDNLPFELHSYDYYASTHNGQQIIQVLADEDTLYLLTCEYFNDDDEGTVAPKYIRLWGAKLTGWDTAADWTEIEKSTSDTAGQKFIIYKNKSSGYYYSAFCIFSTNSVNPAYRKVYLRSGKYGAYYSAKSKNISSSEITTPVYYDVSLSGLSEKAIDTVWSGSSAVTNSTKYNISSAAYFNGDYSFFASPAVVTNEFYSDMTYTNLSSNTTYSAPTCVYWGSGSTLYYITDVTATSSSGSIGASRTISSLAVCSDSIIIGRGNVNSTSTSTSGGITRSLLSNGVPTGTTDFTTNAESQISSGYIVFSLLNANPAEAELDSALYASIGFLGTGSSTSVSYSNIGLWSYYPSRGNWNRE